MNKNDLMNMPESYPELLKEVKSCIQFARCRAILSVNQELLILYFDVGKIIVQRQEDEGWGRNVVERLSSDLRIDMQDLKGFSPSNLWRMRAFYLAWREEGEKLAQPVREIPWGHNITLLEKIKTSELRLWYANKTIENGWSRAVLAAQIESGLYEREGIIYCMEPEEKTACLLRAK